MNEKQQKLLYDLNARFDQLEREIEDRITGQILKTHCQQYEKVGDLCGRMRELDVFLERLERRIYRLESICMHIQEPADPPSPTHPT